MDRIIQIIPRKGVRLFGQLVKKEIELSRKNQGTFYRSKTKESNQAKWSHVRHKGWITMKRSAGEVVTVVAKSVSKSGDQWQLLHALIGFVDRHFAKDILAINLQYR